ncbi:hypothetical protein [Rubripirellula reticaptiva]|uniref:Uncharacterized protein n=1 Tax=Rubripirellula reticaptiva TaxID=2528013 RepID=A0A5C6EQ03_9BACT|nr:hypothetical protein [Rubripirellula reticaptiva]TWU49676.1 hypothetical protein Poly59_42980 [Rubripirellula reticaptiva]
MFLLPVILWWAKEPMRFAIGRTRRAVCSAIMFAIAITSSHWATHACAADDRIGRSDEAERHSPTPVGANAPVVLLREGTMVPPTKGKVVMLGRRWVFIINSPHTAAEDDGLAILGRRRSSLFARSSSTSSQSSAARKVAQSAEIRPRRMMSEVSFAPLREPAKSAALPESESTLVSQVAARSPTQFTLSENLSLQRIVESLRDDSSDDQWILSGEISEFLGENRLTIRTAQRSNGD